MIPTTGLGYLALLAAAVIAGFGWSIGAGFGNKLMSKF